MVFLILTMRIFIYIIIVCVLVVAAVGSTIALMLRYRAAWHAATRESERLRNKEIDWPELKFYKDTNAGLPTVGPNRVVFIGDSITQRWNLTKLFPELEAINRGIGWQTTSEMLVRLRQDVIDLHPVAVIILGGSNDFQVASGPMPLASTQNNIRSMVELARQHGITVLVGTIPPVCFENAKFSRREFTVESVDRYNEWLRTFCTGEECTLVDYDAALRNSGQPICAYMPDGIHPREAGYGVMAQAARKALNRSTATWSRSRGH
jgi:lysophospholipase L1-like esterase